ncbi:hypothetical protein [Roseobacter sp.]|uniref:hypothetical protein n=1 Tax=Roseobacter sp. TaxID=1907202 RepID=UPI003859EEC1
MEDFVGQARTDARRLRLELPEGRKTPLGFEEAANRYVQRLRDSDGKNIDIKDRQLRQHLVPFLAAKPLSAIETFDIERYKKALAKIQARVRPEKHRRLRQYPNFSAVRTDQKTVGFPSRRLL